MTVPGEDQPFDAGLQVERTLLAWRRTTLAIAVSQTFLIRDVVDVIGLWSGVFGVVGLILATLAWSFATRQYRRVHQSLSTSRTLITGGGLPALVAVSLLCACVGSATLAFEL